MKKLIFSLILIPVLFCGCGLLWSKYVDPEYGCSVSVPRFWKKQYPGKGMRLLAISPFKSKYKFEPNFNLIVARLPEDVQKDVFFELNKQMIMASLKGEKTEFKEDMIYAGRKTGKVLTFTNRQENADMTFMSAVWEDKGLAYVITCAAAEKDFNRYRNDFISIMRSLRINPNYKPKPVPVDNPTNPA